MDLDRYRDTLLYTLITLSKCQTIHGTVLIADVDVSGSCNLIMPSFLTPNRHPYSVRFSPHHPNLIAVAASQFYGFAGGGSLYVLEQDEVFNLALIERKNYEWSDGLFDVAWSPHSSSLLLSGSGDGSLQLWNIDGESKEPLFVFREHLQEVYSVNWSKLSGGTPTFLSSSWDKTIKLWDANCPTSLNTYYGHTDLVFCATFSPFAKSTFASVSCDSTLKLWDTMCPSRAIMTVKDADNAELLSCDWSNGDANVVVTGSSDGCIRGFDIRKMTKPAFELFGCESAVRRVQFSHDIDSPYKLAASSFDHSTRVWNAIKDAEPIETFYNHSEFSYGVDWSPCNRNQLVDCGWDSLVHVFSTNSS